MMPQGDLVAAQFRGHAIQHPAPQPRAHRAVRIAERHGVVDHLGDIGALDVVSVPFLLEIPLQDVRPEAAVSLVDRDGQKLELDRGAATQVVEQVEHRVRVLAARHGAQDPVALLDQPEVPDRPADAAGQRLEQAAGRGTFAPATAPRQLNLNQRRHVRLRDMAGHAGSDRGSIIAAKTVPAPSIGSRNTRGSAGIDRAPVAEFTGARAPGRLEHAFPASRADCLRARKWCGIPPKIEVRISIDSPECICYKRPN